MAVTIKQVAERSGLSIVTVSQILNGKEEAYRLVTRERVQKAAREMGYRANTSARAMRTGRYGCVAFLLSSEPYRSVFSPALFDGIHDGLAERGLHLTPAKLPDAQLTSEGFVPKMLREYFVDGMLINYNAAIPPEMIALIHKHNLPSVWINSKHESDCIYPNDLLAGRQAAEHLLALGHTRIAFADYPSSTHYSNADRYAGYESAMQAAGLAPRLVRADGKDTTQSIWEAKMAAWLSGEDRPSAVLCQGPSAAYPLRFAAQAAGIQVPKHLSLVTFYDRLADDTGLEITTWQIPDYALGRQAVEMLQAKIEQPQDALPPVAVPFTLLEGASCAQASPQLG